MVAGRFMSVGRAGYPDVRFGLRSCGHLRVSAHQATSSKKLLPRPLSPVTRLSRGASSISISAAGPTFFRCRYSSIALILPDAPQVGTSSDLQPKPRVWGHQLLSIQGTTAVRPRRL